jgi:hypothetical protein
MMRIVITSVVGFAAFGAALAAQSEPAAGPSTAVDARGGLIRASRATKTSDDGQATAEKLDDLEVILTNWTTVGQGVQSLSVRFRRQQYDSASHIEIRGQGKIHFESPDRGVYTVEPIRSASPQQSSRNDDRGRRYQLLSPKAESLYWEQGHFARIDTLRGEYEVFIVPDHFRATAPVDNVDSWDILWTTLGSPRRNLPGLIETDLEELQQRFEWQLLNYDGDQIVLTGKTLTEGERRHFSQLHVVLDAQTYLTRATKLIDSTGTRELVHTFEDHKVNAPQRSNEPGWAPDLNRLRLLTAPPLAPPAAE